MEHSENFEKVKSYYGRGLWTASRVIAAIGRWITEAEAENILGGA